MKITMGIHAMSRAGGTELNAFQVGRGLVQRGHRLDLVAARGGELASDYRSFCNSVSRRPVFDFARASAPRDLLRMTPAVLTAAKTRPDVIYPNRFAEIVWAAAAAKLSGAPVVCHLHECRHARPGTFPNRHVRRFIAVSDFLRRQWVDLGLDGDRIDVVHNGVSNDDYPMGDMEDRSVARARLGLSQDGFVTLYYGRLDPEKGIDVLLEAWRKLGMDPGEGTLLIVGSPSAHDPNGERYAATLRESAPSGCVWRPAQADVVVLLHAADVVVVPSLWDEPCARVIIETLATGRPAVVSRTGGSPELLEGPFERFLVEAGDSGMLASALGSLVDWRNREPALATLCRDHVRNRFSLDHLVEGVERSLTTAVGQA